MSGRKLRMLLRKCFGEEQRSERSDDGYFCCLSTASRVRKDRRESVPLPSDCNKDRSSSLTAGVAAGGISSCGGTAPSVAEQRSAAAAATTSTTAAAAATAAVATAGRPPAPTRPGTAAMAAAALYNYPPLIPISTDGEITDYANSRRAVGRLCHGDPNSDNSCIRPPPNRTVFDDLSQPPPPSSRGRSSALAQLTGAAHAAAAAAAADTIKPGCHLSTAAAPQHLYAHAAAVRSGSSSAASSGLRAATVAAAAAAGRKASSTSLYGSSSELPPPPPYSDLFNSDSSDRLAPNGSATASGRTTSRPT